MLLPILFLQMGFTALIIAAARNRSDLCQLLLDNGAQIDIKDKVIDVCMR